MSSWRVLAILLLSTHWLAAQTAPAPLAALTVKDRTYHQVTLTGVSGGQVSISHEAGLKNIPLADLSLEQIEQLNGTSSGVKIDVDRIRRERDRPSAQETRELDEQIRQVGGVNGRLPDGNTLLIDAALKGRVNPVRLLIEKGADLEAANASGVTAWIAADAAGHANIVGLLRQAGARPPGAPAALRTGQEQLLRSILEADPAQANAMDPSGLPILMAAVKSGRPGFAELLIAKGAALEAADADGRTVLFYAVDAGNEELVRLIGSKGAQVNARDREGVTPLMLASMKGQPGIAGILLAQGANLKMVDRERGWNALMHAAAAGQGSVAELLLARGFQADAVDREGKTALDLARGAGHTNLVVVLEAGRVEAEKNKEEKKRSIKRVMEGERAAQFETESLKRTIPSYVPALMWGGIVFSIVAQLWLLKLSFEEWWVWGLLVFFLGPAGGLIFSIKGSAKGWAPFCVYAAALVMFWAPWFLFGAGFNDLIW